MDSIAVAVKRLIVIVTSNMKKSLVKRRREVEKRGKVTSYCTNRRCGATKLQLMNNDSSTAVV